MRSPFGQCVIAFLLTAALVWGFRKTVVENSIRSRSEETLAEEKYQGFEQYVEDSSLDYEKIVHVCYAHDDADSTFLSDYVVTAMICALTIIPYAVLLRLIRRFADRLPESPEASERPEPPEEYPP